jgi:hypothetical protein
MYVDVSQVGLEGQVFSDARQARVSCGATNSTICHPDHLLDAV